MLPENEQALSECWTGKRIVFSTLSQDTYSVVTVPHNIEDKELFNGYYILVQEGFKTATDAEKFMKEKGFNYIPLKLTEGQQ